MAKIVVEPKPTVFISYASEDKNKAKKLYRDLKKAGAEPWLDREDILGGQRWEMTIRTAIRSNRYFAAILSSRSVNKRGVIQKEITEALDILKEFPPDDIYLIPIRLDDCKPAREELNKIQWIDMFPKWSEGFKEVLKSLGIMRELVLDFDFMSTGPVEARPLLPITMRNPQNDLTVHTFGLIDTGADTCVAPAGIMKTMGYKVRKGKRLMVQTVGGVMTAYNHTIQIEIHQQSKRKIMGDVVFVSDPIEITSLSKLTTPVLIGKNLLEQFHIDIDYPRKTLTIRI